MLPRHEHPAELAELRGQLPAGALVVVGLETALGVAGLSAGAGAATGITGTAVGGIELDWGKDPIVKLDIPPAYHWYSTHLWAPAAGG